MTTRSQSRCLTKSQPSVPCPPVPSNSKSPASSSSFPPLLPLMDNSQHVSYIIIHDLTPEAKMLYLSPSLNEVLGFEPSDVIGTSSFDWMHPDEVDSARRLHYDTVREDKAAAVAYLRVRNQENQFVPCVIQRSMVHNALIGSISFARPGPKALHTAATAQEVLFLTPTAQQMQLSFQRWNDRRPSAPLAPLKPDATYTEMFDHIPTPSKRTGLILNRFSSLSYVMFCTNDCILPAARITGRSFYDFVYPEDETNVRQWITTSKLWGVSDDGTPSDGGFVFGNFRMCLRGRNSAEGTTTTVNRSTRNRRDAPSRRHRQPQPAVAQSSSHSPDRDDALLVEAIFSAHSDGFIVVLRKAEDDPDLLAPPQTQTQQHQTTEIPV